MFDIATLLAFVGTSLIILFTPGPGVLFVVARGMSQGVQGALLSALGLSLGVFVHVGAACIGLSALLLASSHGLLVVKYLGAAYLLYLGIEALRTARASTVIVAPAVRTSPARLVRDGILVSAFNPKIAVFFLAFLPQFVAPDHGNPTLQLALLGSLYAALAFLSDSTYGVLAAKTAGHMRNRFLSGPLPGVISGFLLIALAVRTAIAPDSSDKPVALTTK